MPGLGLELLELLLGHPPGRQQLLDLLLCPLRGHGLGEFAKFRQHGHGVIGPLGRELLLGTQNVQ